MSTIVVIKLSVTSRKYFLVFNNGSRARFRSSDLWVMGPVQGRTAHTEICEGIFVELILKLVEITKNGYKDQSSRFIFREL